MSSRIFIDSGYLIALIRKRDKFHPTALEAAEFYSGPFLTTNLILMELANSLSKPPWRMFNCVGPTLILFGGKYLLSELRVSSVAGGEVF